MNSALQQQGTLLPTRASTTVAPLPSSRRFMLGAGAALLLLGLTVLVGWHKQLLLLIQIRPTSVPMYYNTALGFALCGVGLLATAREWTLPARAVSSAVIVLGVLTLVQYLLGVDVGIDQLLMRDFILFTGVAPGRMAPTTAFSFVCGGAALLIINLRERAAVSPTWCVLVGILGTILVAIASLTVCLHVLNLVAAYGWGTEIRALAMHTSVGFLLLGSVLLLWTWQTQESSGHALHWLPNAGAAAGTVLTLIGWQVLLIQAQEGLEHAVHLTAVQVTNELRARMDSRILALRRMGERWEHDAPPKQTEWEYEAELNLRDFPGFHAISWTDPSLHIRWLVSLTGNERPLGLHIGEAGSHRDTIDRARKQRKTVISSPYILAQGDRGFVASVPIFANGQFDGIISGTFRIQPLFDTILHDIAPGYSIALLTDAEEFYSRTTEGSAPRQHLGYETALSLHGTTWRVHVWPGATIFAQEGSVMLTVVLTFGLLTSGLLACMVFLAQLAHGRAREVAATNRILDTLNAQLERRVQERTAELGESEGALAQHSLALARANNDLRQLAYISAHDLQEPVRQLSVYTRVLADEYHQHLTGEGNLVLSYLIDGATHISALLSDLLTYLEPESTGKR